MKEKDRNKDPFKRLMQAFPFAPRPTAACNPTNRLSLVLQTPHDAFCRVGPQSNSCFSRLCDERLFFPQRGSGKRRTSYGVRLPWPKEHPLCLAFCCAWIRDRRCQLSEDDLGDADDEIFVAVPHAGAFNHNCLAYAYPHGRISL